MKKIEILAYIEDDVLSVGIRSLEPHDELTMFDGEYHYTYLSIDKESSQVIDELCVYHITDNRYEFRVNELFVGHADDTKTFSYEVSI